MEQNCWTSVITHLHYFVTGLQLSDVAKLFVNKNNSTYTFLVTTFIPYIYRHCEADHSV